MGIPVWVTDVDSIGALVWYYGRTTGFNIDNRRCAPRQAFLPVPVVLLRNVTELSVFWITPNQCQFRHYIQFRQSCVRRGIDTLSAMMPLHCCTLRRGVRRCVRLKRSGSAECNRLSNATALASKSPCNQPNTSLHTPSKGSFRVRQVRGSLTLAPCEEAPSSCRHRSGRRARNWARLSPRGMAVISGGAIAGRAGWASLMVCSNATGCIAACCLASLAFTSALADSWPMTRSQGVAGGL